MIEHALTPKKVFDFYAWVFTNSVVAGLAKVNNFRNRKSVLQSFLVFEDRKDKNIFPLHQKIIILHRLIRISFSHTLSITSF